MIFKLQCCPKTIYGKQTCRNKINFFRNVIGHPGQVFIRCLLDHVRFYRSGAIGFIFCLRGECHRRIESKFTHHFILSSAFVLSYRQIRQPSNQESVNQVIKKPWPPPPLPVAMAHIFSTPYSTVVTLTGVCQECAIRIDV